MAMKRPKVKPVVHTLTLKFTGGQKRLVQAAARFCRVGSGRFAWNTVLATAEACIAAKAKRARVKRNALRSLDALAATVRTRLA